MLDKSIHFFKKKKKKNFTDPKLFNGKIYEYSRIDISNISSISLNAWKSRA